MVEDRLEVTDHHSAGCAPSTPERACFLAPVSKTGRPLRAGARGLPGGPGTGFAVRCSARATACPGRNRFRGLQTYGPEERGEDARARILILSSRKPEPASRNASSFAGGYGGQVAGQGRREAANDRPANGGQFGKLAEGVMMGSERKRARPVFAQTLRRGKQGT